MIAMLERTPPSPDIKRNPLSRRSFIVGGTALATSLLLRSSIPSILEGLTPEVNLDSFESFYNF